MGASKNLSRGEIGSGNRVHTKFYFFRGESQLTVVKGSQRSVTEAITYLAFNQARRLRGD